MRKHIGRWGILLILVLGLVYWLTSTNVQSPVGDNTLDSQEQRTENVNLRAYFPLNLGWEYVYDGGGNEFAPFTRKIMYTDGLLTQILDSTGGANVALAYRVSESQIVQVKNLGEVDDTTNMLDQVDIELAPELVLLSNPVRVGEQWHTGNTIREIIAVDQVIETKAGVFYDVLVVQIGYEHDVDMVGYEYFAKNIGLIRREYNNQVADFSVWSELVSLTAPHI